MGKKAAVSVTLVFLISIIIVVIIIAVFYLLGSEITDRLLGEFPKFLKDIQRAITEFATSFLG